MTTQTLSRLPQDKLYALTGAPSRGPNPAANQDQVNDGPKESWPSKAQSTHPVQSVDSPFLASPIASPRHMGPVHPQLPIFK